MTIYSGKTRISEEEDLWRVIGIHEVTDSTTNERQIISGYMGSDEFYQFLEIEPDIYYDLELEKYRYKRYQPPMVLLASVNNNTQYPFCDVIEGYYTANGFYNNQITPQSNNIYYDQDTNEYYIYKNRSLIPGTMMTGLYYHDGVFYQEKRDISSNQIAILVNNRYEQHPYIEGILQYNNFYSDEVTFDTNHVYQDINNNIYYLYDDEQEELQIVNFEYISPPDGNNEVFYLLPGESETEAKTLITGYKIGDKFYETISAGYIDPVIPDGNDDTTYVYYDQINNAYYFLYADGFRQMPIYGQLEEHETHDASSNVINRVLYYHNYENATSLEHRIIIDGYFVNDGFYTTKLDGDPTAVYRTSGTDDFWTFNNDDGEFYHYDIGEYEIGVLYSGRVNPSMNNFYQDRPTGKYYYYDGSYQETTVTNAYYIPGTNIICEDKLTVFTEDNRNLYHDNGEDRYYVYKFDEQNLVRVKPVSCYFINNVPCLKVRPAMGAVYYDEANDEYFIYSNGAFVEYDNNIPISDENQIVLSLTKADMLLDCDILDGNPEYDHDAILEGANSNKAGLMTADLYNRFIDLESHYKMRISSTPYATLADLESAAPTDENCIYIVGGKKQYVLSDDGTYIQIGDTDLSSLDLLDVASVDDVSDILEQIQKQSTYLQTQDSNLQNQITTLDTELDSKYPTANIITDSNNLSNPLYKNEAVSSKVLIDYVSDILSNTISVNALETATVVERIDKDEDSIRVYYKDIVTAIPVAYISDSLDSNLADENHAYSASLMKSKLDDLQTQINNVTTDGLSFGWASDSPSDATIVLSIKNKLV